MLSSYIYFDHLRAASYSGNTFSFAVFKMPYVMHRKIYLCFIYSTILADSWLCCFWDCMKANINCCCCCWTAACCWLICCIIAENVCCWCAIIWICFGFSSFSWFNSSDFNLNSLCEIRHHSLLSLQGRPWSQMHFHVSF